MEVFGQFGEYLMTAKGELLDEDTSLYETKIDLKRLQTELLLKVISFKVFKNPWMGSLIKWQYFSTDLYSSARSKRRIFCGCLGFLQLPKKLQLHWNLWAANCWTRDHRLYEVA